ncbi:MAG: T9SS type A sorting domain-containing protein, partial [Planctomycetota bacterium]
APGGGLDAPDIKEPRKPQPAWWAVLEGDDAGQRFGWSVCDAGNLNGDAYDEFIVGSPGANAGGAEGVGLVQVFRGGPAPDENDIWDEHYGQRAHDSAGYTITGNRNFGASSVKDYAYSAPYWDKPVLLGLDTLYDAGAVWVRSGEDGNLISGELVNPLKGSQENELSGWGLTGGHFDLDGVADVIVGSPGKNNAKGAIKAYHGGTMTAFIDATIDGQSTGDRFGHAVAYTPQLCPGQLDRQLLVGAPGTSVYTEGYIQAWERSPPDMNWEDTPCQTESGAANNDRFGHAVAAAGIWGEIQTVLIGAPGAGTTGEAYVYWGDSLVAVLTPDSGYSPFAAKYDPVGETVPSRFTSSVYPNPFNPSADISFNLPAPARVRLEIYNMLGQKVSTLVDAYLEAGSHTRTWHGINFSSGVYLYRLQAGENVETDKMLLLK